MAHRSAQRALGALLLLFSLALLAWQWQWLLGLPAAAYPLDIRVSLAPGTDRLLGRMELAAPQADTVHVRLRRDTAGRVWIANVSPRKAVLLVRGTREEHLPEWRLPDQGAFTIDGQRLEFEAHGAELLLGDGAGHRWQFDRALRTGQHELQRPCPSDGWRGRLAAAWQRAMPGPLQAQAGLELGGSAACGNRLPLPQVAPGSAHLLRGEDGGWVLRSSRAMAICTRPQGNACAEGGWLGEQEAPLEGVSSLLLGRSLYAVRLDAGALSLHALQRVRSLAGPAPELPPDVQWKQVSPGTWRAPPAPSWWGRLQSGPLAPWPAVLLSSLVLLAWALLTAVLHLGVRLSQAASLGLAATFLLALCSAWLYALAAQAGAAWGLVALTAAVFAVIGTAMPRVPPVVLGTLLALLQLGLVAQGTLGAQAGDSQGLRYYARGVALAAMGLALLSAAAQAHRGLAQWRRAGLAPSFGTFELGLGALGVLALAAMGLEVACGSEAGVFGFQPVELAKCALLLVTAHVLATRLGWQGQVPGWRRHQLWWRCLAPALVMVGLVLLALCVVRDFSPIVLLAAWLWGTALAWWVGTGRRRAVVLWLALGALACGVLTAVNLQGMHALQALQLDNPRIQVWLDPAHHTSNGMQVQRALALSSQGGWAGSLQPAGAWLLPEVQNDFAPSWFAARFGAAGCAVLVLLQAQWLLALLAWGLDCLRAAEASGDWRQAWCGRLAYFALWGLAAVLAAHDFVSWGTNQGWLPVMGQPMPFVSNAGSCWAFMLCPLLVLCVLIAPEESCP